MAIIAQVQCITRRQHQNPHERITHIGGVSADGVRWTLTEAAAMVGIAHGHYGFYVNVGGKRVLVEMAECDRRTYLKTTADGYAPNTLLELPECP